MLNMTKVNAMLAPVKDMFLKKKLGAALVFCC